MRQLTSNTIKKLRLFESLGIKFIIGTTYSLRNYLDLKDIDISICEDDWYKLCEYYTAFNLMPTKMQSLKHKSYAYRILDNSGDQLLDMWLGNMLAEFAYKNITPDMLSIDEHGFKCWSEQTGIAFKKKSNKGQDVEQLIKVYKAKGQC